MVTGTLGIISGTVVVGKDRFVFTCMHRDEGGFSEPEVFSESNKWIAVKPAFGLRIETCIVVFCFFHQAMCMKISNFQATSCSCNCQVLDHVFLTGVFLLLFPGKASHRKQLCLMIWLSETAEDRNKQEPDILDEMGNSWLLVPIPTFVGTPGGWGNTSGTSFVFEGNVCSHPTTMEQAVFSLSKLQVCLLQTVLLSEFLQRKRRGENLSSQTHWCVQYQIYAAFRTRCSAARFL